MYAGPLLNNLNALSLLLLTINSMKAQLFGLRKSIVQMQKDCIRLHLMYDIYCVLHTLCRCRRTVRSDR